MSSLASIDATSTGSLALFDTIAEMGHEQVVMCYDKSSGYRGVIAVHDTTLGPALGGTRFWNYASDEEAIVDALRLARGMTYKNAVAGLNLGGDVMAAEVLEELAERAEQRDTIEVTLRPDDDALAAAVREVRERGLVGHPAREAERVDDGFFVARVAPEACAAERGSEHRAVDRDDTAVSGRRILAEHELLVPHVGDRVEEFHRWVGNHLEYNSRAMTIL